MQVHKYVQKISTAVNDVRVANRWFAKDEKN